MMILFKKKNILLPMLVCLILLTACKNKNDNENNTSTFADDIQKVVGIIEEDISKSSNSIHSYVIDAHNIGDGVNFNYDISGYNIERGILYKNENGDLYASFENKEQCAIKDFSDSEFSIYDINEKEKCHKFYYLNDQFRLNILPLTLADNKIYNSGSVANDYIALLVESNILDKNAITYTWYRNGKKIDNSNIQVYTITFEQEDADYYVEMTTNDGQVFKSDPVNVKINRM